MDYSKICISCMREKQNAMDVCPYCGLDPKTYHVSSYALEPFSILNGRYLVGKMLGSGGFGITYIAYDMVLEVPRAIKEFFLQGSMYRESSRSSSVTVVEGNYSQTNVLKANKEKFVREAKLLAALDKLPGIVSVYDFFYEGGTAYMVLEYLEGITLKEYVKKHGGKLPYQEVLEKLDPVMVSLESLHKQGVLHRDISPDNIMVLKDGSVKLFDFGGAKIQDGSDQKSQVILRKIGYTPIEQYVNNDLGAWTDEYALAATIYYCICGQVPPESVIRSSETDMIKTPSEMGIQMPGQVEKALMKGLGIRKTDRFETVGEFRRALHSKERREETVVKPPKKKQKENEKEQNDQKNPSETYAVDSKGNASSSKNSSGKGKWAGLVAGAAVLAAVLFAWSQGIGPFSRENTVQETETQNDTSADQKDTLADQKETETSPVNESEKETSSMPGSEAGIETEDDGQSAVTDPAAEAGQGTETEPETADREIAGTEENNTGSTADESETQSEETGGSFQVAVRNGEGTGTYQPGETVTITAVDRSVEYKEFDCWVADVDVEFADASSATTSFVMPSEEMIIDALYKDMQFEVTADYAEGGGSYTPGDTVTLTAKERTGEGYQFTGWQVVSGETGLTDLTTETISFTMPAEAVTVNARYEQIQYELTVISGSGSGNYLPGETVTVTADDRSEEGLVFTGWQSDDLDMEFEVSVSISVEIPEHAMVLTAMYEEAEKETSAPNTEEPETEEPETVNQTQDEDNNSRHEATTEVTGSEDSVQNVVVEDGLYFINVEADNHFVMNINGNRTEDGANIDIMPNENLDCQKFYVENMEGGYCRIISATAGKDLTITGGSSEREANLEIDEYSGADYQKWQFIPEEDGRYLIRSAVGTYIDNYGGNLTEGNNVWMYEDNGSATQKWMLTPAELVEKNETYLADYPETFSGDVGSPVYIEDGIYSINVEANNEYVLNVNGNFLDDGVTIDIMPNVNAAFQQFRIEQQDDGFYTITAMNSGKVLTVAGGSNQAEADLQQYTYDGSDGQKWEFIFADEQRLKIRSKLGTYIDNYGGIIADANNVWMYGESASASQLWMLTKVMTETEEIAGSN